MSRSLSLVSSLSPSLEKFLSLIQMLFFCLQKREKRRWLFRKTTNHNSPAKTTDILKDGSAPKHMETETINTNASSSVSEQRNAAQPPPATVSVSRETPPETAELPNHRRLTYSPRENYAAIIVQTCFRGYLVSKFSINYYY